MHGRHCPGRSRSARPRDTPPVVVKKYANRRLYNTESSSYITLDNLADMVRQGRDFVVYDAKSGEDITRSVLTQIIVEEEGKGRALLPTAFLRQLIGFYGDQMQSLVPRFLEQAMSALAAAAGADARGDAEDHGRHLFPFGNMEEVSRQNMAMMERAFSLFTPFYRGGETRPSPGRDPRNRPGDRRICGPRWRACAGSSKRRKSQSTPSDVAGADAPRLKPDCARVRDEGADQCRVLDPARPLRRMKRPPPCPGGPDRFGHVVRPSGRRRGSTAPARPSPQQRPVEPCWRCRPGEWRRGAASLPAAAGRRRRGIGQVSRGGNADRTPDRQAERREAPEVQRAVDLQNVQPHDVQRRGDRFRCRIDEQADARRTARRAGRQRGSLLRRDVARRGGKKLKPIQSAPAAIAVSNATGSLMPQILTRTSRSRRGGVCGSRAFSSCT